ncbi:MAG TPA: RDD family protein [Usitatibacter sp.]|nr:RDD family protein [Usitatibacter sp.]
MSSTPVFAGFWRRAAAAMVDLFLLQFPAVLVLVVPPAAGRALLLAIVVIYFAAMHSSPWQATLGKRAFGIKVTGLDGERITFLRALGRALAAWLSVIPLFIGLLMAAFTARKQALHDMIAATLVVKRAAAPDEVVHGGGTMPVTGGVLAMAVVLVAIPVLAMVAINARRDYTARARALAICTGDSVKERAAKGLPEPAECRRQGDPK